jgi:hypothetical protein
MILAAGCLFAVQDSTRCRIARTALHQDKSVHQLGIVAQRLQLDLDEASSEYQQAANTHRALVDRLASLQAERVAAVEDRFQERVHQLLQDFQAYVLSSVCTQSDTCTLFDSVVTVSQG